MTLPANPLIPTVAVLCEAATQGGAQAQGHRIVARLTTTETYQGLVVPTETVGTFDANGQCVLQLFPNALGVAGSAYRITAFDQAGTRWLNTTAVVPNSDCNLHQIIVAEPFPPVDAAEQALVAAQGALALVTAQANIATGAAQTATEQAGIATDAAAAANAGAAQTGLDRIATAADRIQTGTDRAATAQAVIDAQAAAAQAEQSAADVADAIPPAGATGQLLAKASGADFDTEWIDPPTGGGGGPVSYNDLTDVPADFPPSAHTHAIGDVTGLQAALSSASGAGAAAVAAHEAAADPHTQYLQAADVGTAATKNAPATGDAAAGEVVLGSDTRLSNARTPTAHGHTIGDVTGLQAALDGKQPLSTVLTNTTASFTLADESKLDGIAPGATANATDAQLRDRATHTGTQPASTIGDSTAAGRAILTAADAAAQRATLGLGDAATKNVGTAAGTVAAGDHTHTAYAGTGAIGSSGLTMATNKLLGRSTASTGAVEEITLGTNLSFSGTTLNASGGSGSGTKTLAVFSPLANQPPASSFATLDTRNSVPVLDFDAAADESAVFSAVIPEGASLTSGIVANIVWMATSATSGNVRWRVAFERRTTNQDSDSFDTATEATSACNGTSGICSTASITCTSIDSIVAGDSFRVRVTRVGTDATNDTMTGDAELVAVELRAA